MRFTLPILFCGAIAFGSICGRSPEIVDTVRPVLSSERLYYDDGRPWEEKDRIVVTDQLRWQRVWDAATSGQLARPRLPNVDFNRDMVLVVYAGRMSAGDRIQVDSAGLRGEIFVAYVSTIEECAPFPAAAYPLEIVSVRRADRPVEWVERRQKAPHCTGGR